MGIQDSNCDSDGFSLDHEGNRLEDAFPPLVARRGTNPFLVAGSAFQESLRGKLSKNDIPSHLEALANEVVKVVHSSSGCISLSMDVGKGDVTSLEGASNFFQAAGNPAVKAAFDLNKWDRDELISTRNKLNELSSFLLKKGFTFEEVFEASRRNEGLHRPQVQRNEFGSPLIKSLKDYSTASGPSDVKDSQGKAIAYEIIKSLVSIAMPEPGLERPDLSLSSGKSILNGNSGGGSPVSNPKWSEVVLSKPSSNVKFDYCPLADGYSVISPPEDVLLKGLERFENCVVGTFTKGYLPFKVVSDFANSTWQRKGLSKVSQKDARTFIFKFSSAAEMNGVLAKGTWYINKKPFVVTAWGCNPRSNTVKTAPLWIKLGNIPDCYWSREGLIHLASEVGPPICADELTSRLDILPFSRFCVMYEAGKELPDSIQATTIDPITKVKSIAEISVSYSVKPLSCSAFKSLGHVFTVCLVTKSHWVPKVKPGVAVEAKIVNDEVGVSKSDMVISEVIFEAPASSEPVVVVTEDSVEVEAPLAMPLKDFQEPWVQVLGKKRNSNSPAGSSESPTPPLTFKNLRRVDEVEGKRLETSNAAGLSKSQRKKIKKAKGGSPSKRS